MKKESKSKCEFLLKGDLFSTKKAIEKKHTSYIGVIFTVILILCLVAFGAFTTIEALNTPFIWDKKEIVNSQANTGKFIDYPFE
jgi:hypothetical protein